MFQRLKMRFRPNRPKPAARLQPAVATTDPVRAVERSRRPFDAAAYAALEQEAGFWALSEAGYFSVRRPSAERFEIVGSKFVGRAIVADHEIRVEEKVKGTLHALIGAATGAELRLQAADAPLTEFDAISRHLMAEFARAASDYVSTRRVPRYVYEPAAGPVLAGKIDIGRTIKLHAMGRPLHFAYESGRVVRDEPLDRLVLAGLIELDRAGDALGLHRETMYLVRTVAGALEEVSDGTFWSISADGYTRLAERLVEEPGMDPADRDVAQLASVALLHQGFGSDREIGGRAPRAWFVDLETLFEAAVRNTMNELLTASVDRGQQLNRRIFEPGGSAAKANPDVVVYAGTKVRAIGDAKYKSLTRRAFDETAAGVQREQVEGRREGRADVYQVLVHAAAMGASKAFLVYASDAQTNARLIGRSVTGAELWVAEVRPQALREDLAELVAAMAL